MSGKQRILQSLFGSILVIIALFHFVGDESAQAASAQPAAPAPAYSCIRPDSYDVKVLCAALEERILAATVRIEMHTRSNVQQYSWVRVNPSHATIMAGRYLVTHNHFRFSLTDHAAEGEEGYIAISLRRADGTLILEEAPLSVFEIVYTDPQTLVLEFSNPGGVGLFQALGLPSADFADWRALPLRPGTELAQINWDGWQARVVWVQIDKLKLSEAVPQIQVNNFLRHGSSGGGVYWNGLHIGNNWARNSEADAASDAVTRRYSIIALNSAAVASFGQE